jgi:flagellar capping protein FliD
MSFDQATFTAAFQANPTSVQQIFADPLNPANPGLIDRLKSELTNALAPGTGSLRTAQKGIETSITRLGTDIANYQVRLNNREGALRKQFASLESVLARLQGQGNALQARLGASNSG